MWSLKVNDIMKYISIIISIAYTIQLLSVIFNNYQHSKLEIICMLIVCISTFLKDFILDLIKENNNEQ